MWLVFKIFLYNSNYRLDCPELVFITVIGLVPSWLGFSKIYIFRLRNTWSRKTDTILFHMLKYEGIFFKHSWNLEKNTIQAGTGSLHWLLRV